MIYRFKADENINNRELLSYYINPIAAIRYVGKGKRNRYGIEYCYMTIDIESLDVLNKVSVCLLEHFDAEMVLHKSTIIARPRRRPKLRDI